MNRPLIRIHHPGPSPCLTAALRDLRGELAELGLSGLFYWVTVEQCTRPLTHRGMGWYLYDRRIIRMPRWNRRAAKASARASGSKHISLRGVLRHEFGHALADLLDLGDRPEFRSRFGQGETITDYAAENADEDFAETFMRYATWRGQLRRRSPSPALRRKWAYVRRCIIEAAQRRPRLLVACPSCGSDVACGLGPRRCGACRAPFLVA
ncbi:MAG: hypothetical protein H0W72_03305 [Planctomycetes bacterium]|nr:hypothetical protein [Planctomycetota bacterium]